MRVLTALSNYFIYYKCVNLLCVILLFETLCSVRFFKCVLK